MASQTSNREKLFLNIPKHLEKLIRKEAEDLRMSVAEFVRHVIKWHLGQRIGRSSKLPQRKLAARQKSDPENKAHLQLLLDPEDMAHLDKLSKAGSFARGTVATLLILKWLKIEFPPAALPPDT